MPCWRRPRSRVDKREGEEEETLEDKTRDKVMGLEEKVSKPPHL